MLSFLIMAGGTGERFWPLSTPKKPKQFLTIFNEKSLIRLTFERILPLADANHIFVSTNALQVEALKEAIPELPERNIIIEPAFKDTAAAIGYGSLIIGKYYPESTIAVLASDHLIQQEAAFRDILLLAKRTAEKENSIVTLGIAPSYPETGYGYIRVASNILNVPTKCLGFKEKPDLKTAESYVSDGHYLWNSGMFIFPMSVIEESFRQHAPKHAAILKEIDEAIDGNEGMKTSEIVAPYFERFEKISIDFAIMEKSQNLIAIPVSFGWSDVGSFLAIASLFPSDSFENVARIASLASLDSRGNIVVSDNPETHVALIGVENCVIAVSQGNVLVCKKTETDNIKKALALFN